MWIKTRGSSILMSVFIVLVASALAIGANFKKKVAHQTELTLKMAEAASYFLSVTDEAQKENLVFPFDSDERTNWNFVPMVGQRKGLKIGDMSEIQREALHALLQSTLSARGYLKATGIQHLERILGEIENRPDYRNPEAYYLTLFGDPGSEEPWGWRFEGHHLSLNFSSVDNELAVLPAFMGSNPSKVPSGPYTGWRILHEEIDVARALMHSFSPDQRTKAIIAETAPREIITGNDREAVIATYEGVKYGDMEPHQQEILKTLIRVYAGNLKPEAEKTQLDRIEAAGYDDIYFAWAGSLDEGEGHYYRVHGPTMLIEYDNTQTNANHIHSAWRDLTNDFGRDLLRQHYERSGPEHGH